HCSTGVDKMFSVFDGARYVWPSVALSHVGSAVLAPVRQILPIVPILSKRLPQSQGVACYRGSVSRRPGVILPLKSPPMYAQRFLVEVIIDGQRRRCPLDWLDAFCMRNFTGSAEFDDTLPLAEGLLEAGF